MGTFSDKLDYLEETKRLLRKELTRLGATVNDEDTFRSYVEKIVDVSGFDYIPRSIRYILDNSIDERSFEETVLGPYKFSYSSMICPRIIYPSNASGEYLIPFSARGSNAKYNIIVSDITVSYSRVQAPDTVKLKITLNMVRPELLILPTRAYLVLYTLINGYGSSRLDNKSFTIGLGFGQSVANSTSNWILKDLNTTKRVVKFPQGFRMDSGSTLYLSKIDITQECMKEMVQNLYDYIGNGETTEATRTISVGSTNKALLTDNEIQEALNKGWKITT